jgi:hypothetical protein
MSATPVPTSRRARRNRRLRQAWTAVKCVYVTIMTVIALYALATMSTLEHFMDVADDGTNHDYSNIKVSLFGGLPDWNLNWLIDYWYVFAPVGLSLSLIVYIWHLKRSHKKTNRTAATPDGATTS